MVQQGQEHAEQRRFLTAVHGGCGGEYRRRFAGEGTAGPFGSGAVPEKFHRCRHVAEPGRTAEDDAGTFGQVLFADIGCSRNRNRRLGGQMVGGDCRNTPKPGRAAAFPDAAGDVIRELFHRAVAAVVENEDFGHVSAWLWALLYFSNAQAQNKAVGRSVCAQSR